MGLNQDNLMLGLSTEENGVQKMRTKMTNKHTLLSIVLLTTDWQQEPITFFCFAITRMYYCTQSLAPEDGFDQWNIQFQGLLHDGDGLVVFDDIINCRNCEYETSIDRARPKSYHLWAALGMEWIWHDFSKILKYKCIRVVTTTVAFLLILTSPSSLSYDSKSASN